MPERLPPVDLAQPLAVIAARLAGRARPPVERWNPPACGDSGITIARDGRWLHEGRPIARDGLVRLFASVLRRSEDGSYEVVTPVERMAVTVEDLPFVASLVRSESAGRERRLLFSPGLLDPVIAGPAHPLVAADGSGRPALGLHAGLSARIDRASWIELAELALEDGEGGVWSDGAFFALDGR